MTGWCARANVMPGSAAGGGPPGFRHLLLEASDSVAVPLASLFVHVALAPGEVVSQYKTAVAKLPQQKNKPLAPAATGHAPVDAVIVAIDAALAAAKAAWVAYAAAPAAAKTPVVRRLAWASPVCRRLTAMFAHPPDGTGRKPWRRS